MKGKSTFTKSEANEIIALIKQKLIANTAEQKKIRDKIRAIGFYASDFGIGGGYTETDFLRVVKILGGAVESSVTAGRERGVIAKRLEKRSVSRVNSDETYILDLCDEVLGTVGERQCQLDFLKGDSGSRLPVDIYYPALQLVIEYRERQHTEEVEFFDRRITVSGIFRGEQRKKYDDLRRVLLPKHGLRLIELGYDDFEHTKNKTLVRARENDLQVITAVLKKLV